MRKYIPSILIVLLLIAIIVQCTERNVFERKLRKENKDLQLDSSNLLKEKDLLTKSNAELKKKTDSLELEIKSAKEKILIIQTKRNEKVNSIDRYTLLDLQRFFAERYK